MNIPATTWAVEPCVGLVLVDNGRTAGGDPIRFLTGNDEQVV